MQRAVVERINWQPIVGSTDGTVDVALSTGGSVSAAFTTPYPPVPRSVVWVDEPYPGAWVVIGAEGGSRPLVHDDFLWGSTAACGDTPWDLALLGAGSFGIGGSSTAGARAHGVFRMTVTGTGPGDMMREMEKPGSGRLDAGSPIYVAARFEIAVDGRAWMAWGNLNAGLNVAAVQLDSIVRGSNASFIVIDNGVTSTVQSIREDIVESQMYICELVVMPGEFVCAWIDGEGPFVSDLYLREAVIDMKINVGVIGTTVGGSRIRVDWVHAEVPGLVVAPTETGASGTTSDEAVNTSEYGQVAQTIATDDVDVDSPDDPSDLAAGDDF